MRKNKLFIGGMLAITLIFGMTIISCKEDYPGIIKITNGTSFQINLVVFEGKNGNVVESDPKGIVSGASKTYEFWDEFYGNVKVTVSVNDEDVIVTRNDGYANPNLGVTDGGHGSENSLLLSGTDKTSLKLSFN